MNRVVFGAAAMAALTCGLAGTANAQMYAAVGGGFNNFSPATAKVENGLGVATPYTMTINTSHDYDLSAALGYRIGQLRFEGEYAHRTGENNNFNSLGVKRVADGKITVDTAMLNAYYDFGTVGGFVPYVGIGVGAARDDVKLSGVRPSAPAGGSVTIINDFADTWGYQAMAGFSAPISANLSFTGQFRYFDDGKVQLSDTQAHPTRVQLQGHSFDLGLRFGF
jgi:opacity protein-like surface antigen